MNKLWPQIRAALITLHLFAVFVCAFPSPKGTSNRKDWKTPVVQSELKNWSENLHQAGISISPSNLESKLFGFARNYMQVQRKVIAPFKPYYKYCGTEQSWRMFIAPHRFPAQLHIDLYQDDSWRPIYQPLSEHNWQANMLESSRMRSVVFRYSWKKYNYSYRHMARWLAHKAALDFPQATKVRLRWFRQKSPSPKQVLNQKRPQGSYERSKEFSLKELR